VMTRAPRTTSSAATRERVLMAADRVPETGPGGLQFRERPLRSR
jgi:hypothetical protein